MPCPPTTRIGQGGPAIVLEETQNNGPRSKSLSTATISAGRRIGASTNAGTPSLSISAVICSGFETELEGFGGSCGRLFPEKIWSVRAERRYASHACGSTIQYAVMFLEPHALDRITETALVHATSRRWPASATHFLHHAVLQADAGREGI
jgi:hypothetical protein